MRGDPGVPVPGAHRVEREGDGLLGVAAGGAQEPGAAPRGQVREASGDGEGRFQPAAGEGVGQLAKPAPVLDPGQRAGDHPQRADYQHRADGDDQHERIGHERPGEQHADGHRHEPAPARGAAGRAAVQDQPGEHDRGRRADVADGEDHHEDADTRLRGEQDREGDGHPRDRRGTARPAPGQQQGDRHHDGVGEGGGDVRRVQVQAEEPDEQGDLRQLGGDERDVGDVPAGQVQVAVGQVAGHQQDVGLVGVLRVGLRQAQVRGEQGREDQQEGRRPGPPPGGSRWPWPRVGGHGAGAPFGFRDGTMHYLEQPIGSFT